MSEATFHALVVDDDPAVRTLTVRALRSEGFDCDWAGNGVEAQTYLDRRQYDVVVTDLVMPKKHGHAMATELLDEPDPPMVVVLTGCLEPRITKDLLARGVDDVLFKPVDYACFAAKIRSLVARRNGPLSASPKRATAAPSFAAATDAAAAAPAAAAVPPISLAEFERRLTNMQQLLPLSSVALDVYELSQCENTDPGKLVATLLRDPALSAEILRLANSAYYNRTLQPTLDVDEAVIRIGYRKIGEIALAMNALGVFRSCVVPWMDAGLACERSLAASIALERMVESGGHQDLGDGVILAAFLHTLGRVVTGSLFQNEYKVLMQACEQTMRPLVEFERQVFPESHTAALSRVLLQWRLPVNVCCPVRYLAESFPAVACLEEPTRTKVELVKVAICLGRIAVGGWLPWDRIEMPPTSVVNRLNLTDLASLTERTRADLTELAQESEGRDRPSRGRARNQAAASRHPEMRLAYENLSAATDDLVAPLLLSFGIEPVPEDETDRKPGVTVVNCFQTDPARLAAYLSESRDRAVVVFVERDASAKYDDLATTVRMPTSYAVIKNVFDTAVQVD